MAVMTPVMMGPSPRVLRSRAAPYGPASSQPGCWKMLRVASDEARVVAAFCAYLRAQGWQVQTEVEHADVVATRAGRTLYAEAKGRTSEPGLDADTMYGQLLRRMGPADNPAVSYAAVVPDTVLKAARRVPAWVRARLRIDLYVVDKHDRVTVATG